jgi:transposase
LAEVTILEAYLDDPGACRITVESTVGYATCHRCGQVITASHGYGEPVTVRHLAVWGRPTYVTLRPRRFVCPHCSSPGHVVTTTQAVTWREEGSPHTRVYEDHLLLQLINSTVEDVVRKEGLTADAVQGLLERRITTTVNWDDFERLTVLGIDEISYKKGHRDFVAILTTRLAGRTHLLAVLPNRDKATVKQFLDSIPQRLRRTIRTVCTDMWDGYVNAVRESLQSDPECQVELVIDRFHVAEHYYEAADTLRKKEMKRLKHDLPAEEYQQFHGLMWLFRHRAADLSPEDQARLERLFHSAPTLQVAYTLREKLTALFDAPLSREEAARQLTAWVAEVQASGVDCFDKFLTTLTNWKDEILNYFHQRQTSGFVEGLNNKVKVLKRRCYGLFKVGHIFQRLYLDLEGYRLFT